MPLSSYFLGAATDDSACHSTKYFSNAQGRTKLAKQPDRAAVGTRTTLPGGYIMGFESEAEMKTVARNVLDSRFTGGPTKVIEEFSYGAGRTDLVLAKESESYRGHRLNVLGIDTAIERDSHLRAFLLLHSRDEISKDYFFRLGAMDERKKRTALKWLITNGFVEELADDRIRTAPHLRRHVTRSYSIELKLKNWQKAVKQAFRSKSFSDYQYVALGDEYILRAIDNIDVFKEYGIGLVSIDRDDEQYVVHYEPDRETPYSPLNKWRLNETTMWDEFLCYASSN